jgi:hypothetical protein
LKYYQKKNFVRRSFKTTLKIQKKTEFFQNFIFLVNIKMK